MGTLDEWYDQGRDTVEGASAALTRAQKWIGGMAALGALFLVLGIIPPLTMPLVGAGTLLSLPAAGYVVLSALERLYLRIR